MNPGGGTGGSSGFNMGSGPPVDTFGGGSGSGDSTSFFDPPPSDVVGDPLFDPIFGSERMGGDQPPGQSVNPPDATAASSTQTPQPTQEPQPTSAAGGARVRPDQQQAGLGSTLKDLAGMLTGKNQQGTGWFSQKQGQPAFNPMGALTKLLGGPQAPLNRVGKLNVGDPQAPQGTEGGGAPGGQPPDPAQASPPSTPQDTQTSMAQRPPVSAAFPTTMSSLAQQATAPTPPSAATPDTGGGPGAAPTAAQGAAPDTSGAPPVDPQVQAITGVNPQQNLQNLLEGRSNITLPQAAQTVMGGQGAPTQQMVAQSRLAGTNTPPTAGFSPVLAQDRQPYAKEIENPRTALKVATMMSFESDRDPVAVAESLQNRTKYSQSTIDNMVSPRFYGPMRKPRMWNRRMAELQRDPARMQKYLDAFKTAARGTNLLGGATDQGSGRDPNVRHTGGRVIRFNEIYNDWGGGPGGHDGARQFREDQQRRVRGGSQQAATEAPFQVAGASFDPEGSGYDTDTAARAGLGPDETGHWPSREPNTGQILKGQQHKSYNLTREGEEKAGYEIKKGDDTQGRYYSRPRSNNPFPSDVGTGAGTLPSGPVLDSIQRMHQQQQRNQGISPRGREGELLDWLIRSAVV